MTDRISSTANGDVIDMNVKMPTNSPPIKGRENSVKMMAPAFSEKEVCVALRTARQEFTTMKTKKPVPIVQPESQTVMKAAPSRSEEL